MIVCSDIMRCVILVTSNDLAKISTFMFWRKAFKPSKMEELTQLQTTPKTIYIADDEKDIREAIKTFLESAGYTVRDFENGDSLLKAFFEEPADLVILDVMMPGSNGFTCCRELREHSHVPIFMLTARDSDLDYQTGLDLGCDGFFTKPVSPMSLVMRVKALFRRIAYEWEAAKKEYDRT